MSEAEKMRQAIAARGERYYEAERKELERDHAAEARRLSRWAIAFGVVALLLGLTRIVIAIFS